MTTPAPTAGETSNDYLSMSDEDFLKINAPNSPAVEAAVETVVEVAPVQEVTPGSAAVVDDEDDKTVVEPVVAKDPGDDEPAVPAPVVAGSPGAAGDPVPGSAPAVVDPKTGKPAAAAKPDVAAGTPEPEKVAAGEEPKVVDYEGFFKQVMTPFKANGKTIELKTPEEALRLMQMGAGYGRKIQDLQPHLKVIRMLEKNDLLDEGKLSFLIDINGKNPDAIKKLIKDSGIDPLDINTADNVSYQPTNHSVSDTEVAFREALDTVQQHPQGQETLRAINQTWDPQSKSILWEEPQLLGVIQAQRDAGVYDQIVSEIDRQKMLGTIPNSMPFLQAYKVAGDKLFVSEGQAPQIQTQPGVTQQPQVIATRTAAPKAQVTNGAKAAAASPTKTVSAAKAATTVNPLAMADDDFLKQFSGRL